MHESTALGRTSKAGEALVPLSLFFGPLKPYGTDAYGMGFLSVPALSFFFRVTGL